MSDILVRLIGLGNDLGTVIDAMLCADGYMTVSGVTADGRKFNINFHVEEKKDGES